MNALKTPHPILVYVWAGAAHTELAVDKYF